MRIPCLLAAALVALPMASRAQDLAALAQVRDRALADHTAWDLTESLTTEIGPRPVGTPAMDRSRDWAVAKLKALGFTNVKVETFPTPAWTRVGQDTAEVVSPYPQPLQILAFGRSPSTPPEGLTAEIALFRTADELLAQPVGALKGKIAVVTQKMVRTQDMSGYGALIGQRSLGPEAERRGAVAYLARSVTTADSRLPHTGTGRAGGIPSGALSSSDADLLERMAARGRPVVVRIRMRSTTNPAATAYNVSGELPGSTDELVIVGGHLDSWDPGTGAVDDAAGVGITLAAAKLAAAGPGKPRRTLRVVLWGSEEQFGSSAAYVAAHKDELGRMVVVGESDAGADRIYAAALPKEAWAHPAMRAFAEAVTPLGVIARPDPAAEAGPDVSGLAAAGAPFVDFSQDLTRYFDLHHSADDTLDKVDPRQLAQNVAVWAAFLHAVAYSDIDFRKAGVASTKQVR